MKTEVKWALVAAVGLFLILIAEKLFGLQTAESYDTWILVEIVLSLLLAIFVFWMLNREKREIDLAGSMTWNQGFWAGALMTLIFIPLGTLLVYIFLKWVNPEAAQLLMVKGGSISGKDPVNNYLYLHLINSLCGGLILALIFPIFMKNRGN